MEYLAPGVYVEEVSSGNKPIEGASTSTAAAVGVTQRGPVNTPTLVTSYGEFNRLFGGLLDHRTFTQGRDALPYAVQGFFNNGGQRIYISRIVGVNATHAAIDLYANPIDAPETAVLAARANASTTSLSVQESGSIDDGDELLVLDDVRSEYVTVSGAPAANASIVLSALLRNTEADASAVTPQTVTEGTELSAHISDDMVAGGPLLLTTDGANQLAMSNVVRISDTQDPSLTEYVVISNDDDTAFDEGGLLFDHPQASTQVHIVTLTGGTALTVTGDALAGSLELNLSDTTGLNDDSVLQFASGEIYCVANNPIGLTLAAQLVASHPAGSTVTKQVPMLRVHARYPGNWGNSVRARVREAHTLETTVSTAVAAGETVVVLDAVFGLSPGSYIALSTGDVMLVEAVNRANNEVTFSAGLTLAVPAGSAALSQEYDLIIERIEAGKVVEAEAFEKLGMHPSHTRYGPKIVGSFNRATGLASNSGESELVRLSDLTLADDGESAGNTAQIHRASLLSPLVARLMRNGVDDLATIDELAYIGNASDDPDARSGIQSLANEESISMVAAPGQTSVTVQKALLMHCELMRYRFAVLESPRGSNMAEVTTHRQNFDTTRAALYHPWLIIPDTFGEKGDLLSIAPSGHVMGIYARTDTTRGVWKAPANEVVRGILQFETTLTKGQQDILNPNHINVFRDFRTANRGLRLWGARTLSSDPEWKYVNVRRLFLYLEQSIERGLQFAVFEPNSESLWASVKQSISNFLLTVWRNGGLEGVKEEEAFFVNVGYNVTMTQTDIDNGRLIVEVGVAPVKPAEFVIIRIAQKTREATE